MHAIVADGPDQLAWREVADITPDQGEVLIKVAAAGINRADLLQAAGHYPPPPGASEILGMEVSGTVGGGGRRVHGVAARARGLRFAGRRRLRRVRGRSRRAGHADSGRGRACTTRPGCPRWPARCGPTWS